MRLSTVGRNILAEVCIIFNNCSVTESNDSLTLAKKRKLGGLRSYFEGGEKWKNISMDFFFLVKVTRCAVSVWFEISCPASQDGYNLCEGGVRVCGDAVLLDFWCGFAVIFILSCGITVLQNQAVCGN